MSQAQLAALVFFVTYGFIVSERIHKTTVALLGAMVLVALHVLDGHEAFEAIDLNVIFLLAGMMMIANTLASTGVFQWVAIRAAKLAHGSPVGVALMLATFTAVASAFLDNVTTIVLIVPVALVVAQLMEVPVGPGIVMLVFASNIGGTATLIGDPPNILIASHAGIDFLTFAAHIAPASALSLVAFLAVVALLTSRWSRNRPVHRERVMSIDDSGLITDVRTLRLALIVLGFTIAGFVFHGTLGYEPSIVALMGGSVLMLITRQTPEEMLRDIEWPTLFFFIGLFIIVSGLERTGVLEAAALRALAITRGDPLASTMLILWMSAVLSGIVDNIPYTATMLPVVERLQESLPPGSPPHVLWWALTLGADLGGNFTIVAASANVIAASLLARAGSPLSFSQFFRWGSLCVLGTMLISSFYLWLRYFYFAL